MQFGIDSLLHFFSIIFGLLITFFKEFIRIKLYKALKDICWYERFACGYAKNLDCLLRTSMLVALFKW